MKSVMDFSSYKSLPYVARQKTPWQFFPYQKRNGVAALTTTPKQIHLVVIVVKEKISKNNTVSYLKCLNLIIVDNKN